MYNYPEQVTIHGKTFGVLLDANQIEQAVERVATEINRDYKGTCPVFVITLKGAVFFAVDLLKKIDLDCFVESIRAKSYGGGMVSTGNVLVTQMSGSIEDKDVIIIEDIVDTGLTVSQLIRELSRYNPRSIKIATFLLKPDTMKSDMKIDYVGVEIPPAFVVGYGLDYAEIGRNYPVIYSLIEPSSE